MFFKCDEDSFSVFDSQTEISVLQLLTQWSYRERKSGKGILKKSCTYLLWLSSGVIRGCIRDAGKLTVLWNIVKFIGMEGRKKWKES